MKYSIIIPYYFRDSMRMTFHSFRRFYSKRDDYEVIIVEDIKNHRNPVEHSKLMAIIGDFPDIPARCLLQDYCESKCFNAMMNMCRLSESLTKIFEQDNPFLFNDKFLKLE